MERLTLLLWLALCGVCYGEMKVFPSEGKFAGYVSEDAPGKWIVCQEGFMPVESIVIDGGKAVVWQGDAGVYGVMYFPPGDANPVIKRVVLGKGATPGPGPGPNPPPPPPPGGPYQVVMVYDEQQLDNLPVAQRDLLTSMVAQGKIAQAGHVIQGVFAAQSIQNQSGKLAPFFKEVLGKQMPRLAVAPISGGAVREYPLPASLAELEALLSKELP